MQQHVTVSPTRWWHLPELSRLIRESRRRHESPYDEAARAIVWAPRWSPTLALLQSVWAPNLPGVRVPLSLVVEQAGRPAGLGQLAPRAERHHWEVTYLATVPKREDAASAAIAGTAAGSVNVVAPAWRQPDRNAARLLGALCDAGVMVHADRLFAQVPEEGGGYELFRQLGFSLVVREFSYYRALPERAAEPATPAHVLAKRIPGLRRHKRADAFGVLQLYQETTPKMVQVVEGKRSRSWEPPRPGLRLRLARRGAPQRWVVERDGRKLAWVEIAFHRRTPHQVRIVVDDRVTDVSQSLVDFVVDVLSARPGQGVLVQARDHQQRLISALEASGFILVDERLLMAKMLATPVLQTHLAPVLEKVI